jgi:hypothetical protein
MCQAGSERHRPYVATSVMESQYGTDLKTSVFVHRCILSHPSSLFVHNHFVLSRGHKHVFSTVFENIQNIGKL